MRKIILPLLLIHLLVLTFLGFTAWPEMTLWPYLVLKGWLPYRDIAVAHNPLLIFGLAGFYKIFGLSLLSLKIFSWLVILLTDVLVYVTANKLTKNYGMALLSLAFYILWQPFFEGNGLWFDLALAPIALLIFYSLWVKKFFWSGIFLGLAILIKQTAVWFIVPLIGQIWLMGLINKKNLTKLVMGGVLPLLGLVAYLFFTGTLADFYFWAVKFGIFYLPKAPGQVLLPTIKQILALAVPFGLLLPAIFLQKERKLILVLLVWFLFASLGVYPRWSLFHFQPALPFLVIISGLVLWQSYAGSPKIFEERKGIFFVPHKNFLGDLSVALQLIFLAIIMIGTVYFQARFYRLNWGQGDRFFEKETLFMAQWLKENTRPGQKIFIFNSWDNLYALSDTLPATRPWVPILPWYLEYPGIQEKMVADLEKNKPKLIVFEPYKATGLGSYTPLQIEKSMKENYTLETTVAGRFWVLSR